MKWKKGGLIYVPDGTLWWAKSHAMTPTPDILSEDLMRIYFTSLDVNGAGRVGYIDVNPDNPGEVFSFSEEPVLNIGLPGTFDENGVLATSILTLPDGTKYMYYVGFELGAKIRYRMLTGLACKNKTDTNFTKISQTPILERTSDELFFRCGTFTILDNNVFKMWYIAGSDWMEVNGKNIPVYTIKYAESFDGIKWPAKGEICITPDSSNELGFGRPYVFKDNNISKMFYSIRGRDVVYQLGYAESTDGKTWIRKDKDLGLETSKDGLDSEMICYSSIVKVKNRTFMFYNGNDFGKTGILYAELQN